MTELKRLPDRLLSREKSNLTRGHHHVTRGILSIHPQPADGHPSGDGDQNTLGDEAVRVRPVVACENERRQARASHERDDREERHSHSYNTLFCAHDRSAPINPKEEA